MKNIVIQLYNFLRIIIVLFYICIKGYELYNSIVFTDTYENVYVGEYLFSIYPNIQVFRLFTLSSIVFAIFYAYSVYLYQTKHYKSKLLPIILIITDILFVILNLVCFFNPWY
jgi:hypothetical protein